MRRMLHTIANRNVSRGDIEIYRKYVLVLMLSLVSLIYLAVTSAISFARGEMLLGAVNLAVAAALVFVVVLMIRGRRFAACFNALILIAGLFFLYLFLSGGVENTAHLWCLAFPVISSVVVGHKRSLVYALALLLLMIGGQALAHTGLTAWIPKLTMVYMIRFGAVYVIIAIVSGIAEWVRAVTYAKLRRYQSDMEKSIKELECTRASLREQTNIDPLTEIHNKRFLGAATEELVRGSKAQYVASMFFDIDDFKKYNDHYGHVEGDKVLVKVVNVVRRQVRYYNGILARFGGEELVFVFMTDDSGKAEEIARRIIAEFARSRIPHVRAKKGHITVSIGIAYCLKEDFSTWKDIVTKSDVAMYRAKKNGKNTYHIA